VDLKRLRLGEWLASAGGVVLFVALFADWYGASVQVGRGGIEISAAFDAWETFDVLDIVLVAIAALATALAPLQAVQRGPAIPVAAGVLTTLFGVIGVALVAFRIIDQPGPNEFLEVRGGAWLGLLATIAIAVGGWESIRNERVRGLPPDPEPELRSLESHPDAQS
jgi:hypothetical protein